VILVDHGDNCGAGGTTDIMAVLQEVLAQGLEDVVAGPFCDPPAWPRCLTPAWVPK
jgi:microcystin degradation protein MlrC